MKLETPYRGPALFSYGFRPFFLVATLFALVVIPAWWSVWTGGHDLHGPMTPVDWHIHEMVFGYGAAVVAGFLFTAVPNWTGRLPTRGWPLAALLAVWAAGRVVMWGGAAAGPMVAALIDQAFLLLVAAMIAREIVAGRNWRNLKVLVPVTLLWAANLAYHAEAALRGSAATGHRAGIALLVFLIVLIGGRIIPSFTRNWLVQRRATVLPAAFGLPDAAAMVAGAAALLCWIALPAAVVTAAIAAPAAALHIVRLARWRGAATWRSPLLLMLHVAYLFVPVGLAAVALAALGVGSQAVVAHIFGIGAVAGMTMAVMIRASMGHTGRDLVAGRVLSLAFAMLVLAVPVRTSAALSDLSITGAASLWSLAYLLLAIRLVPMLTRPKVARRVPNPRPRPA